MATQNVYLFFLSVVQNKKILLCVLKGWCQARTEMWKNRANEMEVV